MLDKNIHTLVIGGDVFIGLPFVCQPKGIGRKITVLGRRKQSEITLPEGIAYVQGDFANLALINEKCSQKYNINSGIGRSINEVVSLLDPIIKDLHQDVACEYLPERSFDVRRNVLNCSKACKDFWRSVNIDFIDRLRRTSNRFLKISDVK